MKEYENQSWRDEATKYKPIYLLIDTSGSMDGQPIGRVQENLELLVDIIKGQPVHKVDTLISIISFDDSAEVKLPMTPIREVIVPELKAGGMTALDQALDLMEERRKTEIVPRGTEGYTRDKKPNVFIMTDGLPNDSKWEQSVQKINREDYGIMIGLCALDENEAPESSKKIEVIRTVIGEDKEMSRLFYLQDFNEQEMRKFFTWISQIITTGDPSGDTGAKEVPTGGGVSEPFDPA